MFNSKYVLRKAREAVLTQFTEWTTRVKNIIINNPNDWNIKFEAQGEPANSTRDADTKAIDIFKAWINLANNITVTKNEPKDNPAIFTVSGTLANSINNNNRFNLMKNAGDLSLDESISTNFWERLSLLESIPKDIREVSAIEKIDLDKFGNVITDDKVLIIQLLSLLKTLRPDPNQLIPQLQEIVEQISEELSPKISANLLKNLKNAVLRLNINTLPLSIEEVFTTIEAEVSKMETQEDKYLLLLIKSLSEPAKKWLGNLLIYLVNHPEAEIDLWNIL